MSVKEPPITLDEAKAIVGTKVYPRVTEESIKEKIAKVDYKSIGPDGSGTICIITMKNGWVSTGFSAPADMRNYDPEVGMRYAYDSALKPLWQLEGYLLRQRLFEGV